MENELLDAERSSCQNEDLVFVRDGRYGLQVWYNFEQWRNAELSLDASHAQQ